MATTDFELKDAFIEGAKAGHGGMAPLSNPFLDTGKRDFWILGFQSATTGWHPLPSFRRPLHLLQSPE